MSKYCTKCGTKLFDDDLFCSKCGASQEIVENTAIVENEETVLTDEVVVTTSTEEVKPLHADVHQKRSKKVFWGIICGVVVVAIIAVLAIFLPNNKNGLGKLDEIEQELNEAFIKAWEGYDIGFDGVTDFDIENVDEDTHDQTFSCFVLPSADGVTGLRVIGLAKDGKVVQLQSIYVGGEDAFNQLDKDSQAAFMALVAFPISIYKKDIDTVNEFANFLGDMEVLNDGASGPDNMRTVDGKIEYTYMGGSGNEIVMSSFTIRYLPAFQNGFFEDDEDPDDAMSENNDDTTNESNAPSSTVSYDVYDDKIAEYRTALTMGSEAFDAKYDSGFDYSSINAMMVRYSYNYGGAISYATFDIDENGTDELIFSDSNSIIDIYTIHNNKLVKLFENCDYGERSRVHVLADGRLLTEGSSGASAGSCEMYRIDASTGKLSAPASSYYCDGMGPNDYMTGYIYMSEDEYYDMLNKWTDESIFDVFEWTMIAENPEPDWGWDDGGDSGDDEIVYSENGKIKLGSYSSTEEGSWDYINLVELTSDNVLIFNTGEFAGVAQLNGSVGTFNITGSSPDDDGTQESFVGTIAIDKDFVTVNITSTTENIASKSVYKYESAYFFGFNSMYADAFSSFTSTTLGNKYISHQYLGTAASGTVTGMLILPEDTYYYHDYDFYKVRQSDGVHYYALGMFFEGNNTYINAYECQVDSEQVTLKYLTHFGYSW